MPIKFNFSSRKGVLVEKFAFATAILKIETLRMRRRFARVLVHTSEIILVPRGRAPFGQHQESRPLAVSNNGSPRFTDLPSLCACSESSLTNLIGSDLNLLCLQIHSKQECRWTWPEVAILGADQKERGLWGRECSEISTSISTRKRNIFLFFLALAPMLISGNCHGVKKPNLMSTRIQPITMTLFQISSRSIKVKQSCKINRRFTSKRA